MIRVLFAGKPDAAPCGSGQARFAGGTVLREGALRAKDGEVGRDAESAESPV